MNTNPRKTVSETRTKTARNTSQNTINATLRATLDVDEAAAYVGCSRSALARFRLQGGGPRYVKLTDSVKGRVLYRPADLDAWMETRARNSTSEYAAA